MVKSANNRPCPKVHKQVTALYQNVRGLKTKLRSWKTSLLLADHTIVAATETFLDNSVEDAEVVPDGWLVLRRDRGTPCGGVLLAARPGTALKRRRDLETACGEDLWASFVFGDIKCYVCVVYIKPSATDDVYMNWFCQIESFILNLNCKLLLIIGDINMKSASQNINNYYNYFLTYCNLIDYNTICNVHGSKLDVVLARDCIESQAPQVSVSTTDGLVPPDAYHPPLEITVSLRLHKLSDNLQPSNIDPSHDWNFSKMDFDLFTLLLAETSWARVVECEDVVSATCAFYEIIYELFDLTTPKKHRHKLVSRYPVWFSQDVIKDIRRKSRLHKEWIKSKSTDSYKLFSVLRAELKTRISRAYNEYILNIKETIKINPKHFWRHVNSLRSKGGFEPSVSYKGSLHTGVDAAEAFADYFSSVFLDDLPHLNPDAYNGHSWSGGYISIPSLSPQDVERGLGQLKLRSSSGPDSLPSFILKTCKKHMTLPLYHIFNLCLRDGTYPNQWKISRVTPIPKSGNRTEVGEYRPIAILCSPAKVFEYILHKEIYRQIKQYLGDEQHGFRPGRSVNTNLLCMVDYISSALDRGIQVDVVYFDFQKAFDKIDNDILIKKLFDIGFTPNLLKFFVSYMRDRRQFVRHGTYVSEPYHTRSGVSQGSVMGPLLFSIMINDLSSVVNTAKCLLYADDLKLILEIKSPADCLRLQSDIDSIYTWSISNRMLFNISKCCTMTFDRKRSPIHFNYNLGNSRIDRVTTIKDLGVTFDRGLTFHGHISNLAKECYRRLGFVLRNAREFQDPLVICTLFNSLVRSKLESSACVWSPHHITYTLELEKVQKSFLRSLYKLSYGYYPFLYPTLFLLGQLGYNSLEVRRLFDQLSTCCKILRGSIDSPDLHARVCRFYVPDKYIRHRPSRRHNLFSVPACRTVARAQSPLCRSLRHLNALLVTNPDIDFAFDKWQNILLALLTYCENV